MTALKSTAATEVMSTRDQELMACSVAGSIYAALRATHPRDATALAALAELAAVEAWAVVTAVAQAEPQ